MNYLSRSFCSKCKEWDKPLIKLTRQEHAIGTVQYHYCRECNNEKQKKHYNKNTVKLRNIIYKSIRKHRAKQTARERLNYAVRAGKINKPDHCTICKKTGRICGHHHDYSQPLQVEWMCTGCHADIHRKESVA